MVAFSDNPALTQEEFFLREFGIHLNLGVSPTNVSPRTGECPLLIASSSPLVWVDFLRGMPVDSVIFFLLGNETYETATFEALNGLRSLRHVFVYNPPKRGSFWNPVRMLLGHLLDRENFTFWHHEVVKDFKSSIRLRRSTKRIKLTYPWSEFPEGYSNSFVQALGEFDPALKLLLGKQESLYSVSVSRALLNLTKKETLFSFVGQTSRSRRFVSVGIVDQRYPLRPIYKVGFGGTAFDGDLSYVRSILGAQYPLIPPGWLNNSNHRYSEALLSNGLPAILAQNSTDPMDSHNWTQRLSFPASHSFKSQSRLLAGLSVRDFREFLLAAKRHDFERIAIARLKFESLFFGN